MTCVAWRTGEHHERDRAVRASDRGVAMRAPAGTTQPSPHAPVRPPARPATGELPAEEPERFSMRVGWQADLPAAETALLLEPQATGSGRVQESSRRRLARAMSRIREQLGVDVAS